MIISVLRDSPVMSARELLDLKIIILGLAPVLVKLVCSARMRMISVLIRLSKSNAAGRVCTTPPPMLSKHYQDLGEWPSHRSQYVHPSVNESRLLDHHLHVSTSQDGLYPSSKAASSHARTLFEATQKAYIPRIVSGLSGSRPVPVSTKCQSFFIHPKHVE